MSVESNLQSEIRKYLRSKGCYVIKTQAGPGVPKGCTDIIFMLEGFWGGIEVKKSPKAGYQTLQEETIEKFEKWSFGRRVDPTTWPVLREELERIL